MTLTVSKNINERVTEIIKAVDEMLRRLENWIQDPKGTPTIPEPVAIAIQSAAFTCENGDVPQKCRELVTSIARFLVEYQGYERRDFGKSRHDNSPGPHFWAAAKVVQQARAGAERPTVSRRESVASLRRQGVSDMQIASAIYGHRGEGPFMMVDGTPDIGLLDKEEKEPGSVIPEDWIPEWERDAYNRRQEQLRGQLDAYDKLQNGTKYEDPDTVEDLLRQGAFVQQIERAKNVSRRDVLKAAKAIGVEAVDGPAYSPEKDDDLDDVDFDDDRDDESSDDIQEEQSQQQSDPDAVKKAAIDMFVESGKTLGAAEIAASLRKRGLNTTHRSVAAFLSRWNRSQKPANQTE